MMSKTHEMLSHRDTGFLESSPEKHVIGCFATGSEGGPDLLGGKCILCAWPPLHHSQSAPETGNSDISAARECVGALSPSQISRRRWGNSCPSPTVETGEQFGAC